MTPPSWLARVTPWRLLHFVNRHTRTCWAHMVMWKMYPGGDMSQSWWPEPSCFSGPEGQEFDYCGRWQTREEMGVLPLPGRNIAGQQGA